MQGQPSSDSRNVLTSSGRGETLHAKRFLLLEHDELRVFVDVPLNPLHERQRRLA